MASDSTDRTQRRRTPAADDQTFRGRRLAPLLVGFVACVLLVNALAGENGFLDTIRARRQYQDMALAVVRLERENANLREQARQLREDPRTIEGIARRDLGLIRPGEILFIVRDVDPPLPID